MTTRRPVGPALRGLLRPLVGRDRAAWRLWRAPRLRHRLFRDDIDCVVYGLLASRRPVFGVQIGSNDGRAGDPLWAFRRYPNWRAILVEPLDAAFRRLEANFAPWTERFTLVRTAIAGESGRSPFFHLDEAHGLPPGWDQLGTLDVGLLRRHLRQLPGDVPPITTSTVRCMTFEELCERYDVRRLDLLHIDAEGLDHEILRQVDLARRRPAVVLYEHVHLSEADRLDARSRLRSAGYATREIGGDTLAVRREALDTVPTLGRAWRIVS